MKGQKTTLWWHDRLQGIFLAAFLLAAMLGVAVNQVFLLLDALLLAAFFAVEFTMNRCPHCDRYLDRGRSQFCQHCGQRIREEKPET